MSRISQKLRPHPTILIEAESAFFCENRRNRRHVFNPTIPIEGPAPESRKLGEELLDAEDLARLRRNQSARQPRPTLGIAWPVFSRMGVSAISLRTAPRQAQCRNYPSAKPAFQDRA